MRAVAASRPLRWISALVALHAALLAVLVVRLPPFLDEGIYATLTQRVATDPSGRFAPLASGKEPLLEWLATLVTLVGVAPFSAGRLVSATASTATVVLVAVLARQLAGWAAAVAATALAAVCPFLLVYGALGLYEALATLLAVACLTLQVALARTLRLDAALGAGMVLGLALLTKSYALMLLALWPVALLCFDWSAPAPGRRLARYVALSALGIVIGAAIHAVLRLSDLYDDFLVERDRQYPVHSLDEGLSDPLRWLRANGGEYADVLVGYLSLPVLAVAAVGLVAGLRRRERLAAVLAVWAAAPVVGAVLVADTPFPRYVHAAVPPLLVLGGDGLATLLGAVRRQRPGARWAVLVTAALVLVAPVAHAGRLVAAPGSTTYPGLDDGQLVTDWPAGTGWDGVRRALLARAGSGEQVVARGSRFNQWLELSLGDDERFRFVADDDPLAVRALFTFGNGEGPGARPEGLAWGAVHEERRPRDGVPLVLYESGALVDGAFLADPEALRAALGGDDADYDAFLAARPAVREWADAEYGARG